MTSERVENRDAAVGAFGGALLVAHALATPVVTARIVDGDWGIPGASPATAVTAVRLFETVPLLLVAVGCSALVDRYDLSSGSRAWDGVLVALTGLATTVVFHWCLRLLAGPALPGTDVAFLALGYYLGWTLTNAGLFVCGASLLGVGRSRAVPLLLVLPLPAAAVVGALAAVTDVASVAAAHGLVAGGTWILVGGSLWTVERRAPADRERSESRRADAP